MYDLMEDDDVLYLVKVEDTAYGSRWVVVATFHGSAREIRNDAMEMRDVLNAPNHVVELHEDIVNEVRMPDEPASQYQPGDVIRASKSDPKLK